MAQSYVTFTGNGSSTGPITLGFNYILKAHVKVYEGRDILANTGTLKSETTHYTFNTAGTQISMVTAPANGVIITIERQTPNDDQIVPYADGSNLIADSLNNSDKQTLFCTQELEDRQELSAAKADAAKTAADAATGNVTTLTGTQFKSDGTVPMTGNLNAGNNKVINVTDPTNAQDAVTKAYLERTGSIASAQIADGTIVDGDVNASAAISGSKLQASSGSNAGSMSSAHYSKLEGIEASATADQSATEIKSSYESNSDTNAYTDAEKTKLSGIETSATADQSASEIKSSYESNSNTNAFTDANKTLVDAISATSTEINYTTNVTSDIQSQINNKQPLDSELTTLSGMTSATASKLAAGTNLTSDIADLNQVDGLTKQTTISDSDASFPTSGAVVDYVAAQISPLGGLEVVATEVAFPNTQPASGVVISISDAGGVVINGSGVSTTGRTVGGATITINGFPSSLQGETLVAGVGLMVSSTGSSQTYNYHKILGKEDDIKQLSDDINDFNARYRVGSSNPSSALDAGDLFFNTSTSKLLVYNATNTAWEEAQSIGNFYISTLSPAFNGTLQDFTITNAPTNAEQILLSINGVIQKPNAGSSTPSEGFALSGSTVKLGAAPASTDTYFAVVIGSTVNIGTPSNNTVTNAILQSGCVDNAKVATNAAIVGSKLADDSIAEVKLDVYNAPSGTDKFLAYTSNGMEWAVPTTISFANDANNRVVTGTGSGLNGEANLTFDGTLLKLQCDSGEFRVEAANGVDAFSVDSDNGNTVIAGELDLTGKCLTSFGGNSINEAACIKVGYEGSSKGQIRVYGADASTTGSLEFKVCESDGTDDHSMLLDGSGRLLLGTTTEGYADADDLTIANSASGGMTIRTGSSNAGTIAFSDGTSGASEYAGYFQYSHSSDKLVFGAGSTEKMHLTSTGLEIYTGNGVGASDPGYGLKVFGGTNHRDYPAIYLSGGANNDNSGIWAKYNLTLGCDQGNAIAGREISFNNGDARIAGVTHDGITFGTDSAAANALDGYEEGTFTPEIWKGSTQLSLSASGGRYVKVGQLVSVSFYAFANNSTLTAGTSKWQVRFPFSTIGAGPYAFITAGYCNVNGAGPTGHQKRWQSNVNGTDLVLYSSNNTTNWSSLYMEFSGSGTQFLV